MEIEFFVKKNESKSNREKTTVVASLKIFIDNTKDGTCLIYFIMDMISKGYFFVNETTRSLKLSFQSKDVIWLS